MVYDNATPAFRLLRLGDHRVTTLLIAEKGAARGIGLGNVYAMVADPDGRHLYFTQPDAQALRRLDVDSGLCETLFEKDARVPNPAALCLYKGKLCVADRNLPTLYQVEPHATATGAMPSVVGAELTQVAQGDHMVAIAESDGVLYAFQAADTPWVRLTSSNKHGFGFKIQNLLNPLPIIPTFGSQPTR